MLRVVEVARRNSCRRTQSPISHCGQALRALYFDPKCPSQTQGDFEEKVV